MSDNNNLGTGGCGYIGKNQVMRALVSEYRSLNPYNRTYAGNCSSPNSWPHLSLLSHATEWASCYIKTERALKPSTQEGFFNKSPFFKKELQR
jgi:hypothetical protein